jgi:hypothetical protein
MTSETEKVHLKTDGDWNEYVISLLSSDELDDGSPTVAGLRRVVELLVGCIVSSTSHVYTCPTNDNRIAVVKHTITLDCEKSGYLGNKTFEGVADCTSRNTDAPFNAYLVATADTRAEGRALRRALGLKKAVAEELSDKANELSDDTDDDLKIKDVQLKTINTLCQRCNIDALAFINSGEYTYIDVKSIKYNTASNMIQQLNKYQQSPDKIPENLLGFKSDWLKSV